MEIDNRKEQIIKAAIKRFSHFGVAKTTMNEIAEDSSISKGNVYYYFADKNALITEVIYALLAEFEELVNSRISVCNTTISALQQIQRTKSEFFQKYYRLNIFEGLDCFKNYEHMRHISETAHELAVKIISNVLDNGIKSGELRPFDVKEIGELYIEANRGIHISSHMLSGRDISIDKSELEKISKKQMRLANIFINAYSLQKQ